MYYLQLGRREPVKEAKILAVVDMQVDFPAARDRALCARIEAAAASFPGHVMEVRSDDCGESTLNLNVPTIWKPKDDGGDLLYSYLFGFGAVSREMQVFMSGVNMGACVYATACGLASRLKGEHGITNRTSIVTGLCGDHNTHFRFVRSISEGMK